MQKRITIASGVSIPLSELTFRFSRSTGSGGQHVNKVSTRVEVEFNVLSSSSLNRDQRDLIARRLSSRLTSDGAIRVSSQATRSQWKNREDALEKLAGLLRKAMWVATTRRPSVRTSASRQLRLRRKRLTSRRKHERRAVQGSDE
jgi:ribosome-associated protein